MYIVPPWILLIFKFLFEQYCNDWLFETEFNLESYKKKKKVQFLFYQYTVNWVRSLKSSSLWSVLSNQLSWSNIHDTYSMASKVHILLRSYHAQCIQSIIQNKRDIWQGAINAVNIQFKIYSLFIFTFFWQYSYLYMCVF